MDSTLIASLVGAVATLLAGDISIYFGAKKSNDLKIHFETTDYIKHVRSHGLPVKGLKKCFINASSIDELSLKMKSLTVGILKCEHFEPELMKTTLLTSINIARRSIDAKEFDATGNPINEISAG